MSVTDVTTDRETLTLTLTARFEAPIERVWELWADPRLLERWWGPPGFPATFTEHDFEAGGRVAYHMTGPDGTTYHGWWHILSIDRPHRLSFEDGFADEHGTPNPELPVTRANVRLSSGDGGTDMVLSSRFASLDQLEQVVKMGVEEGLRLAVGQIDGLLEA